MYFMAKKIIYFVSECNKNKQFFCQLVRKIINNKMKIKEPKAIKKSFKKKNEKIIFQLN